VSNNLLRRIAAGDHVVILSRYAGGGTVAEALRVFRCSHGAGMHPTEEGTGIWGTWAKTGVSDRIESYMIEKWRQPQTVEAREDGRTTVQIPFLS
jgi:hypothetical protein